MKSMKVPEKQIEVEILYWLRVNKERLGLHSFKVRSTGTYDEKLGKFRSHGAWFQRGCPDILVCHHGRFIGLEVKARGGKVSIHQKLFHEDISNAGGQVHVVRSLEEVKEIFK